MDGDLGFLVAIREAPDDVAVRLVYADWLEEQGDPRGHYLRLICQLEISSCVGVLSDSSIYKRLLPLQDDISHEWEVAVCRPYSIVLLSHPPEQKISMTRVARVLTGMGLADAVRLINALPGSSPSRSLPRVIAQALTLGRAQEVQQELCWLNGVSCTLAPAGTSFVVFDSRSTLG